MAASSAAHLQNKYADVLSCLRRCRTKPPACVFGLCWCAESRTARVDGSDGRELEAQPQLLVDFLSFRFDLSR